jgi:hypothetical protein
VFIRHPLKAKNLERGEITEYLTYEWEYLLWKQMNLLHYLIIILCIIFILSGAAYASEQNKSVIQQSGPGNHTEIISIPSVQSVLENPDQYYGKTISLHGVVSSAFFQKYQFTVADRVGCSLCTAMNAKNSITIRYAGKIPKYRDIVQITGEVIYEGNKGYYINASVVKS